MTIMVLRRALAVTAGLAMAVPLLMAPTASAVTKSAPGSVQSAGSIQATWTATGSMSEPRASAAGVLLNNGKVMMIGGLNCNSFTCVQSATTELYDAATGSWSPGPSMSTPRAYHRAVQLPNGKVLVAGGNNSPANVTAELYDPATNSFTSAGTFTVPRFSGFQAVLMADGRVLLVGGCCTSPDPRTASAEIYDPATNSWSPAASMATARDAFTATLLPNGKVLVAGGFGNSSTPLTSAELYNPATNTWSSAGTMSTDRWLHEAALMPNGKVLVVSGECIDKTSEVYNPATNSWGTVRVTAKARSDEIATPVLLNDGKLLVQGGNCSLKTGALYNSAANTWTTGPDFASRRQHVMTRLRTGKVLAAGGENISADLATAQLYTPSTAATAYATPDPVQQGTPLTVAGSGFLAGETVELSYKGAVYASTTASGAGKFSLTFPTGTTAPKNYIDAARGVTSGRIAYFHILVTS